MPQQGRHGVLTAGRTPVDPDPGHVVVVVLAGHGLVPEDPVREAGVPDVLPGHVVEGLRAVVGPHAVDLGHDEPQLGDGSSARVGAERFGDVRPVGSGVDALDDRIAPVRIEVGRADDDPPDVRHPVPALGHEDLGVLPSGRQQRRSVGPLQLHDQRPVGRPAELGDGGLVDSRPLVDVVLMVGGEGDFMHAVGLGVRHQPGAVEVDAVVVDEVGVLLGVHAVRAEPDLAVRHIHAVHAADRPLALGDLILHLPRLAVEHVEVVPAVALGHPDDLPAVVEVVAEPLVGVVEEGLGLLGDHRPRPAGFGVDFDDPVDLVPPLVVLEDDVLAVLPPLQTGEGVGIGEEVVVDDHLPSRLDVQDHRDLFVQPVAGLGVQVGRVLGLELVLGGGFDVVHHPLLTGHHPVDRHLPGVRRPDDGPVGVGVSGRAFPGEHGVVPGVRANFAVGHVVVLDEDLARAVRREDRIGAQVPPELAGACRPGHAARAHAAALAPGRLPLALARVGVQIAPPGGIRGDELDGLLVVGELDPVEREFEGGDLVLGEGGDGGEGCGEALVIESGALGTDIGVHKDEVVPSFDRLPVPEAAGFADPGRAFGDVDDQTLEAVSEAVRSLVVGKRALGSRREGCAERGEGQDQGEAMGSCGQGCHNQVPLTMSWRRAGKGSRAPSCEAFSL